MSSPIRTVCIVGASGKLGQCMVQHCLDRGWSVVGVCRPESVSKLDRLVEASEGRLTVDDQVKACDLIFGSDRAWTVVRGSSLEEGPSEGLPIWRQHVGDPALASDLTRRSDFALFMVEAVTDESLVQQVPAIVGCASASAQAATRAVA